MAERIVIELDKHDAAHVRQAMDERRKHILPGTVESDPSNESGELIAEICRGWMEFLGIEIESVEGDEEFV